MDICLKVQKFNRLIKVFIYGFILWMTNTASAQTQALSSAWSFTTFAYANLPSIPQHREIYFANAHGGLSLFASYSMKPKYDLRFGLKLNTLAYSRNATDSFEVFTQRIREYYVEAPVSLFYYPSRTERTWGFYAGLTPSILLNKSVSKKEENPAYYSFPKDPSSPGRFDIGLNVGATLKLAPRWLISADYTYSFTNGAKEPYNSGRFSQYSIGVGFQINQPNAKESEIEQTKGEEILHFKKQRLVVLVRLKTEAKKIKYYQDRGYYREVEELQETVKLENQTTMNAFETGFTYCEVRYFYDTLSKAVAEELYDDIVLNSDGTPSDLVIGDSTDVLIAEFGSPYSEAFGSSSGFGLVVFDYQFNQMKEPFPYYVSTFYGLVSRNEAVIRFDKKLREYQKLR